MPITPTIPDPLQLTASNQFVRIVTGGTMGPRGQDSVAAGAIITDPNELIIGDATGQPVAVPGSVNVRSYGAVGDGSTDDTAALAAAFTAADSLSRPVVIPAGTYLTSTIQYKGQSIIGDGSALSRIKGKASQDVLHVDSSVSQFYRDHMTLRGFTIEVNDTVDAAASFPQRHGVGNAGFAVDYADGSADAPLMLIDAKIDDLWIVSSSFTFLGQNNSCGIYTQFQTFNLVDIGAITIERTAHGWYDDYPTSNLTSSEHARDHVRIDQIRFRYCGDPWRICNAQDWSVGQVVVHQTSGDAITFVGVTSSIRETNNQLMFDEVMLEGIGGTAFGFVGNDPTNIQFRSCSAAGLTDPMTWPCRESVIDYLLLDVTGIPTTAMTVTGFRNTINVLTGSTVSADYQRDLVVDTGFGNKITLLRSPNVDAQTRMPIRLTPYVAERHVPDATSLMQGYVDPMYVSGNDFMIHPRQMSITEGPVENTDYEYVADATTEYGVILRQLTASYMTVTDSYLNGPQAFRVGKFLPKGRVRCYTKVKANAVGTQVFKIADHLGNPMGSVTLALTTSWTIQWFDADLSSLAVGETLRLDFAPPSAGLPVDVAWIAFRPYAYDVRISSEAWNGGHLVMGAYHLWIDSTGDLRIKSSAPSSDTDGAVVGSQS